MNQSEESDDIDVRLAALPRPTLNAAAGARIHARARAVFVESASGAMPAAAGAWARLWNRALEPVCLALAVAVYLIWTAHALAALDWGRLVLPAHPKALSSTSAWRRGCG